MIVNYDMPPKYSFYYIGSVILNYLKSTNSHVNIDLLFNYLKSEIDEDMSINFLYLSLDWLYLLSLIKLDEMDVCLNAY